jgi:lysyl-tRNA synthetase class 2
MATLKELRDERLRKLKTLKELGINPYPAHVQRSHKLVEITDQFENLQNQPVNVAGRIINIRKLGQISFIVIKDNSSKLQLFLRKDKISGPDHGDSQIGYDEIHLLDAGDFISAKGDVIKTQTGEISVEVEQLRLLTKSLRPMPTNWDGFSNKEERLRRRYIDLNINKDVYDRFIRRSQFWQATRQYLIDKGFIEINIPVLEHTTGGADAAPFLTHMDALNQDFYLRISQELPLKRLIGGGYEKVFDIGPRFRNENYSEEHSPEHIAMEWYWAYADWRDGITFMTDMYRNVIQKTFGKLQFELGNFNIDLNQEWTEIDYASLIKEHYNIDVYNCDIDEVKEVLRESKLEVRQSDNLAKGIDKLWKNIRKDISGPSWVVNTPLFISPLAKINPDKPTSVQRFQPIIAGSELGNGFSELNDPLDQLNRFTEQQKLRDKGDAEAMMLDIDYIEMLEYGMPPACGWGYSERVFWVFEGVSAREGVPFPQLRTEFDPVTRSIYPEVFKKSNNNSQLIKET